MNVDDLPAPILEKVKSIGNDIPDAAYSMVSSLMDGSLLNSGFNKLQGTGVSSKCEGLSQMLFHSSALSSSLLHTNLNMSAISLSSILSGGYGGLSTLFADKETKPEVGIMKKLAAGLGALTDIPLLGSSMNMPLLGVDTLGFTMPASFAANNLSSASELIGNGVKNIKNNGLAGLLKEAFVTPDLLSLYVEGAIGNISHALPAIKNSGTKGQIIP